jgi:hypothetical protein
VARRRLLLAGTLVLLVAECLLFVYLVVVGWIFRELMLDPGSPEVAVRIRTVFANGVWLVLNLIGLGSYIFRRKGFGRSVILFVLAFDILNSLYAAVRFNLESDSTTAVEWFVLTLIPATALVLVLMQRPTRKATEPRLTGGR